VFKGVKTIFFIKANVPLVFLLKYRAYPLLKIRLLNYTSIF